MSKLLFGFLIFFLLAGSFIPPLNHAHVGHSDEAAKQETPPPKEYAAEESEYAIGAGEPTLDRTELMDEAGMGTTDHSAMPGMDHGNDASSETTGDHSKHPMPPVTLSKHELISPSQKGYYAAVGITIFAGLVFGILSIKRH